MDYLTGLRAGRVVGHGSSSRRPFWHFSGTIIRSIAVAVVVLVAAGAFSFAFGALSTSPAGQKTWYWQNPLPQGNALLGVDAVGSDVWAVGGPGVVLHSSDDGAQWDSEDPVTQVTLRAVDFVDASNGWVVGDGSVVKRTADGGSSWTTQTVPSITARGVSMATDQTGWIVGSTSAVRKTVNGGSTWTTVTHGLPSVTLNGVKAVDSTHAWAVGSSGTIMRTIDGSAWTTQTSGVASSITLNGVDFVNLQTGFAVGTAGTVLKTTNGGSTWSPLTVTYLSSTSVTTTLTSAMQSVSFRDQSTGWIAGATGLVLFTQDGGMTWTSQKSGAQTINGVIAAEGTKGHLVGANGVMLRTDNNGTAWQGQQQGTTSRLNGASWTGPTSGVVVGASGLVMTTEDAGDSWATRTLGGNDLYAVKFVDNMSGWIVGSGGFIRRTTNAGASWSPQTSGTSQTLYSVTGVNAQTGWAVGAGGTILKTVNGGAAWAAKPWPTGLAVQTLYDVHFLDSDRGWAAAGAGYLLKTIDGGESWTWTRPVASAIYSVHFVDTLNGWFTSTAGRIYRTSNGGTSWTQQGVGVTNLALYSIEMADVNNGWAVGGASTGSAVLRTTNGGTTWIPQSAGFAGILRQVTVANASVAGIVGDAGAMRRTFDAGATWESTGYWSIATFRDLSFATSDEGWAAGDATIAHTHDGGRTWGAQQPTGTNSNYYGIDFVTQDKGWAVGTAGQIRTTTSHTTWAAQTSGVVTALYGVDFRDASVGWAVGASGVILGTQNGGSAWTPQASAVVPTATTLWGVSAVSTQTAFAWGSGGVVAKTVNGGSSWTTQTITAQILYSGSFVTSQTGWVVGAGGVVFKTTNGGSTWTPQTSGVSTTLRGVTFLSTLRGYIVGDNGVVRVTTDGGDVWTAQNPGTLNQLNAVGFTDVDHGWLVGNAGTILRTTDTSPPETTIVVDPPAPNGNNGWFLGKPQISFVSSEPGLTYYSWTSATGPWKSFSVPIVPPADGELTVHWYSIDPGGNKETVKSMTGKVDATPPSTPATPSASVQSASKATLAWAASIDAASGIDHYEVRNYGSLVGTSPVSSMTLSSLTTETAYSFSVTAVDIAGNVSPESGEVSMSTLAGAPRAPVAIYAADAGARGVVLNWGESTGTVPPVTYRVWRSVAGTPFSAIATVTPGAAHSYVDTSAPGMAALRYGISVLDGRGEGAMSSPTTLTVAAIQVIPPPVSLQARNTASVTLTWSPAPLAVGYHVYRSTTSTGTEATLTISGPTAAPTYHDATTAAYTEYWYSVATVDASDNVGAPSGRVYIRTEAETSTTTTDSPHGAYSTDTNMCAVCHRTHSATGPLLLTGTSTIDAPLCLSCHDGTSASDVRGIFMDETRTSRHPVPMGTDTGTLQCSSCHGVHSAEQATTVKGLLRAGPATSGDDFCYQCHNSADDAPRGAMQVFEESAHATAVAEPANGTKVICLSCHVSHTSRESGLYPYSGDDRCLGCHSSDVLSSGTVDIATRLSGADAGTRHDLLEADGVATGSRLDCSNCHEPHTSSATTPCVDPDSPTTTHTISASGTTLCLRCHDESMPTSTDTSGWAPAPLAAGGATTTANIASAWDTNFHGGGASVSPNLKPSMGYAQGDDLECASCHDPHGSINRFALLETVEGTGTATAAPNLTVAPAGAGWDLRFFCGSCHDLTAANHTEADISAFPVNCTDSGCHTHVGNGL